MIIGQSITIKKAQDEIGKKVQDYIKDIAIDLSNEMKHEAPVYRGGLRDSIQVQETSEGDIYVGTNVEYAPGVQFGTEPHYVPLVPLEKWARRKFSLQPPHSFAAARGVQSSIKQRGTEPNPFVSRAKENIKEKY